MRVSLQKQDNDDTQTYRNHRYVTEFSHLHMYIFPCIYFLSFVCTCLHLNSDLKSAQDKNHLRLNLSTAASKTVIRF